MDNSFKYLMITNNPVIAAGLDTCGVDRIFVDLEINGKNARQGHLDTVISHHSLADVSAVKAALKNSELLVRINPYFSGSAEEIEEVINRGADIIMLPMFKSMSEIESVGKLIAGRAKFIPLVETIDASNILQELDDCEYVDEVHIGLNDLHLEMGLKFMFQLLESGYLEQRLAGFKKPFGIGGIARVGSGEVDGELVMAEHVRLGSRGVILSRAFHQQISLGTDGELCLDKFSEEFKALNAARDKLLSSDKTSLNQLHDTFCRNVRAIVG
ncbi:MULTISPECIES: aldolase/citrate lyase family protein [Pseudoalteromonas]|uniref:Aldolase n=1 Tax=Pseudoalteromonas rubra TaxID=43658 RepID=A0A5S3V528_9GAMM|nr:MULTISPECIES: aldolase/citrate lyase family protein [Pseudoalteromonas]MCG7562502.1 aldolase/citrate lyase family protein [Pseudoalteromonas sp. McH1-42]QPB84628.1 aldolase [Pseudoalteromonas rubra]